MSYIAVVSSRSRLRVRMRDLIARAGVQPLLLTTVDRAFCRDAALVVVDIPTAQSVVRSGVRPPLVLVASAAEAEDPALTAWDTAKAVSASHLVVDGTDDDWFVEHFRLAAQAATAHQ